MQFWNPEHDYCVIGLTRGGGDVKQSTNAYHCIVYSIYRLQWAAGGTSRILTIRIDTRNIIMMLCFVQDTYYYHFIRMSRHMEDACGFLCIDAQTRFRSRG